MKENKTINLLEQYKQKIELAKEISKLPPKLQAKAIKKLSDSKNNSCDGSCGGTCDSCQSNDTCESFKSYDEDENEILRKLQSDEPIPIDIIVTKNRHGRLAFKTYYRNPLTGVMYE